MAGVLAQLYQGQPATTVPAATVFTATNKTLIKEIIITNTTSNLQYIEIYVGLAGAAAAVANALIYHIPIQPNGVVIFSMNKVIANTDVIRATQTTAAALTLHISGVTNAP
jgi:hypothetical protein